MRKHRDGRTRSALRAVVTLLLAIPLASSSPARGDDGDPGGGVFDRTGPYLGLGGVYALENFDRGLDRSFDDSAGVNLRFGYRAFPNLAFELTYEWLEGFDSTDGIQPPHEYDTHLITANAKLLGLNGRCQPYALVGGGVFIVNLEHVDEPGAPKPYDVDAGFAARFGGGVDFYLGQHFVINLEGTYLVPTREVKEKKYGTLGLGFQYRF
jgi:hypothetical protein